MASFNPCTLEKLEQNVCHLLIPDLTLNPQDIIDEGTAAIVYKHQVKGKSVAIKSLKQQLPKKKVLEVANMLRTLQHKNIVGFRGYSIKPCAFALEFCYVELQDETVHNMAQLIDVFNTHEHFVYDERMKLIKQASQGLQYLHYNGIIHRDFKPSNLLVSGFIKDIVVKVSDFDSFVTMKQTFSTRTKTNVVNGMTLAYTAPELCMAKVTKASMLTDVYSWSICVFEILTNQPSAWAGVLPLMNDQILINGLQNGIRPEIENLVHLYSNDDDVLPVLNILKQSWSEDANLRPQMEKIIDVITGTVNQKVEPVRRSKRKKLGTDVVHTVKRLNEEKERLKDLRKNTRKILTKQELTSLLELTFIDEICVQLNFTIISQDEWKLSIQDQNPPPDGKDLVNETDIDNSDADAPPLACVYDPLPEILADFKISERAFHDNGTDVVVIDPEDDFKGSFINDSGLFGDMPDVIDTDDEKHIPTYSGMFGDMPDVLDEDDEKYIPTFSDSAEDVSDDNDATYVPLPSESLSETTESEADEGVSKVDVSRDNVIQEASELKPKTKTEKKRVLCQESTELKDIVVATNSNTKEKRIWDKIQVCMFCSSKVSKIARHLLSMHKNEIEVAEILAIEKNSSDSVTVARQKKAERHRLLSKLRKRGNFNHNMDVLKEKRGWLLVEKRPNSEQPYTNFLPCEYCLGFYHKRDLRSHHKRCAEKPVHLKVNKGSIQSSASMLLYTPETSSPYLTSIISKMKVDDVSLCVKSDRLIIQYGNKMCLRLRKEGDQQYHISNKMRELARLVLETRKCCADVKSLRDCLDPRHFGFVVEAATELAGWNDEDATMATPSIGIKLGHSLKKCAKILKGEGIRNCSRTLRNQADNFTTLVELSWNDEISRVARTELEQRKWNAPKLLPLTSDLQSLRKNLKNVISSSILTLGNDNTDTVAYRNLCTAVLTTIILFNRRRAGEPSLLTLNDFLEKLTNQTIINDEIKQSLTEFEQQLCSSFKRIEIRGKRGRKVPLLLTKEMEKGIQLLIDLRAGVGTNPENPFVFPVIGNGSVKNVRGPDAVRKHVRMCNLQHPEAIYSTNLRKHIATMSQLISLEENELELLANFLGHDISIHRQYYRLPENTLQVAKVSKLMMLMEAGGVGKQHGKTLDEIEVNLDELVPDEKISEKECAAVPNDIPPVEDESDQSSGSDTDENKITSGRLRSKPSKSQGKKTWSEPDKEIIRKDLDKYFRNGKCPGAQEILKMMGNHPENFEGRSWRDIKYYVNNYHQAQKRKGKSKK